MNIKPLVREALARGIKSPKGINEFLREKKKLRVPVGRKFEELLMVNRFRITMDGFNLVVEE